MENVSENVELFLKNDVLTSPVLIFAAKYTSPNEPHPILRNILYFPAIITPLGTLDITEAIFRPVAKISRTSQTSHIKNPKKSVHYILRDGSTGCASLGNVCWCLTSRLKVAAVDATPGGG